MTKSNDAPLPFDAVAFAGALIGGPVVVTVITAFTIIPLFALVFGGPLYLIVGTPVLLWMVGRYPPDAARYALAGIVSIFALMALAGVLDFLRPDLGAAESFAYLIAGAIFAPLWAGTFAPLYRKFNRMARLVP